MNFFKLYSYFLFDISETTCAWIVIVGFVLALMIFGEAIVRGNK